MSKNFLLDKLEGIKIRFEEVGQLITDPAIISDMKKYVKLNKEYRDLEPLVEAYKEYKDTLSNISSAKEILATEKDEEMREMAKMELEGLEEKVEPMEENIKVLLLPKDPEDNKNAIVEIRAGTGGDEASIFAGDLFRMYTHYCEEKKWKVEVTNISEGTVGGYKEIVMKVSGDGVYGILKYESGVHRVQRVPQTETQGRVHTSAATVAVLPEAEEFDI
ncbi:MAG TPA: PCRF domain-containing protein, partial [Bacteroidales bacterium]|nr:PCRF domain-containing protein [Bacteroidales bacterium]